MEPSLIELKESLQTSTEVLLLGLRELLEEKSLDNSKTEDMYVATCRFMMRVVALLFFEDRGLTPVQAKSGISLRLLHRKLAEQSALERSNQRQAWSDLTRYMISLGPRASNQGLQGSDRGNLFQEGHQSKGGDSRVLAYLERPTTVPTDEFVYQFLSPLTQINDFSGLKTEYLGLLYEELLEFQLKTDTSGHFFLVRWEGTRKGGGVFYTPSALTHPTTYRTLEPHIYDLKPDGRCLRTPEQLLSLRICDPSMGAGRFLMAALNILTEVVFKALWEHKLVERSSRGLKLKCSLLTKEAPPYIGCESELKTVIRQTIARFCLHGVDRDPIAVQLARIIIWIEVGDTSLTLDFLHRNLRVGDALVGAWLNCFWDYPLSALTRKLLLSSGHQVFKAKRARVYSDLRSELEVSKAQCRLNKARLVCSPHFGAKLSLRSAFQKIKEFYEELFTIEESDKRVLFVEQSSVHPEFGRLRQAFDIWCSLWFWPPEEIAYLPLPRDFHNPSKAAIEIVERLKLERTFFHWELEYPEVFARPKSGFDVVLGNPPWNIQKPNSKEFFSRFDPLYKTYAKQKALVVQFQLFHVDPEIEACWKAYRQLFQDSAHYLKHVAEPFDDGQSDASGVRSARGSVLQKYWRKCRVQRWCMNRTERPYRYQGRGDLNTYKSFLEQAHHLLRDGGTMGMLVPSGLYSDYGTADIRRFFLEKSEWRWLYSFENRRRVFDIHSSFKFCVAIIKKGGRTATVQAAFLRLDLEDWVQARGVLSYSAKCVENLSPKSTSIVEIGHRRDLELLEKLYTRGVLIGNETKSGWGIHYRRELDMTNDSALFITRSELLARGYLIDDFGRCRGPQGKLYLPLYEGRMIGQFDFSQKAWIQGKGRSARWTEQSWEHKRVVSQFLVAQEKVSEYPQMGANSLKLAFVDTSSASNQRSMLAASLRSVPCGNVVPVLHPQSGPHSVLALSAILNSFVYDFCLRAKLSGLHINYYVLAETPLVPHQRVPMALIRLAAKLSMSHLWYLPTWRYMAQRDRMFWSPPSEWPITPHERLRLRCMVDAIVAKLYGLSKEEFAYVLRDCDHPCRCLVGAFSRSLNSKGFWRVGKTSPPELRHTVLSYVAFLELENVVREAETLEQGIDIFCGLNDGKGWLLPESLCLSDLALMRTVNHGVYEQRAQHPQPVRSAMGRRFLEWQETSAEDLTRGRSVDYFESDDFVVD